MDVSVVNVALPSIKKELNFETDADLQWIITAYSITYGGLLLIGGKIGDYFGRKFAFIFGTIIFTAASLLGALSTDKLFLIIARAFQGVGGSILSPATLTIITVTFTDPIEKGKALGAWSGVASAGGALGALVGGLLVQAFDWRAILYINIPIGVVLLLLTVRYMKESREDNSGMKIDVFGAVFITSALVAFVFGISRTSVAGWVSWDFFWSMFIALSCIIAFVVTEKYVEQPLVTFSIFRNRNVLGANLVLFVVGAAMFT